MVYKIACVLFVTVLASSLAPSFQDKKDGKNQDFPWEYGSFESYKGGILTLKVDNKDKEFKVPGDTPVGYTKGKKDDEVKTQNAKEHLKDVKKGTLVTVTFDRQGKKVLAVCAIVSELPKDKPKEDKKKGK